MKRENKDIEIKDEYSKNEIRQVLDTLCDFLGQINKDNMVYELAKENVKKKMGKADPFRTAIAFFNNRDCDIEVEDTTNIRRL